MKIQKILKQPEGKTLEFKRDISSLKPILKTLVAFANTAGGILLIGRENDSLLASSDSKLLTFSAAIENFLKLH